MTTRKLNDEGVARLDISAGRAELLEEIMALQTTETLTATTNRDHRRSRRWLPAAAAAAVAALVVAPLLLDQDPVAVDLPVATQPLAGSVVLLKDDAWRLYHVDLDSEGGEDNGTLAYRYEGPATQTQRTGAVVEIDWRPAEAYRHYVRDRNSDLGDAEDAAVLGVPARMWTYSATDHAVLRQPHEGNMVEIRGQGMRRNAFLTMLDELTMLDPADLEAHLPEEFVTAAERPAVIASMLEGVALPDGFDPQITSWQVDRRVLGTEVVRAVTCAWLERYESDDAAVADEAAEALIGARDWPVLAELDEYADGIREIGDRIRSGRSLEGIEAENLGCQIK